MPVRTAKRPETRRKPKKISTDTPPTWRTEKTRVSMTSRNVRRISPFSPRSTPLYTAPHGSTRSEKRKSLVSLAPQPGFEPEGRGFESLPACHRGHGLSCTSAAPRELCRRGFGSERSERRIPPGVPCGLDAPYLSAAQRELCRRGFGSERSERRIPPGVPSTCTVLRPGCRSRRPLARISPFQLVGWRAERARSRETLRWRRGPQTAPPACAGRARCAATPHRGRESPAEVPALPQRANGRAPQVRARGARPPPRSTGIRRSPDCASPCGSAPARTDRGSAGRSCRGTSCCSRRAPRSSTGGPG